MTGYVPLWEFFTNPVLSISTVSSMLMCLASSLVAVVVFVRKRSLLGEALAHAAYPGIGLAVAVCAGFFLRWPMIFPVAVIAGAFCSSMLGMKLITYMEEKLSIKSDSALCFVLSTFLGVGILISSRLQFTHPMWYQKIQMYIYGQAATMMTVHAMLYGLLTLLIAAFIVIFFYQIQAVGFDRQFARVLGLKVSFMETVMLVLIVIAVSLGIRSVGVVLMAGMLIAPAAAARQLTNRLSTMFVISGVFGLLAGLLGNYLAVNLSILWQVSLPTGPMIVIAAVGFTLLALIFAPGKGLIFRVYRKQRFQIKVLRENILKELYKSEKPVTFGELKKGHRISFLFLWKTLLYLTLKGWLSKMNGKYALTSVGTVKAKRIVRLHRLWEVYLYTCLGIGAEKVHRSAEEMEHILTPELERELGLLLNDPKKDPHDQCIPEEQP